MHMKTALIASFAAAAALVGVSADANARSWNYKRTACGPSATIVKHNRYGFVGSERDYGVRSRTTIRGESARFGIRGGHDRIGQLSRHAWGLPGHPARRPGQGRADPLLRTRGHRRRRGR